MRVGDSYRITSRLRVAAHVWEDSQNEFMCSVSFVNNTVTTYHNQTIDGVTVTNRTDMTREKYLKITQNAKLSYIVLILKGCVYGVFVGCLVWKLQGKATKK